LRHRLLITVTLNFPKQWRAVC